MICPFCNEESLGLAFCDNCGKEFPKMTPPKVSSNVKKAKKPQPTQPVKNQKANIKNNKDTTGINSNKKTTNTDTKNSYNKYSTNTNERNNTASYNPGKYIPGSASIKSEKNDFLNDYRYSQKQYEEDDIEPKKHNFFWWLGAILIWPISISILFYKSKDINLDKPLRAFILSFIWLIQIGTLTTLIVLGVIKYNQFKDSLEEGLDYFNEYTDMIESYPEEDEYTSAKRLPEEMASAEEIELIAGELGIYGEEIIMNEGTDYEYSTIIYRIPDGTYNVTNMVDSEIQINLFFDNITVSEDGIEEWADGYSLFLDAGATEEIFVEPGYIITLDQPAHIILHLADVEAFDFNANYDELNDNIDASEDIESAADKELLKESLTKEYKIEYLGKVKNDVTGLMRASKYSSKDSQNKIALKYYKAFFEDSTEIHALINQDDNTIARIEKMDDNDLSVTIFSYTKNEEKDYDTIFGGEILSDYNILINSGKEEVLFDENTMSNDDSQTFNNNDTDITFETFDIEDSDNSTDDSNYYDEDDTVEWEFVDDDSDYVEADW